MELHNMTLSSFKLNEDAKFEFSQHEQSASRAAQLFANDLHATLNAKQNKVFLNKSEDGNETIQAVIKLAKGETSYSDCISAIQKQIKEVFPQYGLCTEGTIITAHYEALQSKFLYFAVLEKTKYFTLDEANSISERDFLDASKCLLLSRIDLTEFSYSTINKKTIVLSARTASPKYRQFFSNLFACDEGTSSKRQSKDLVSAVVDYTNTAFDTESDEERYELRQRTLEHCTNVAEEHDGIVTTSNIDEILSPDENKFSEFYKNTYPEAEDTVSFDKNVGKSLIQYKGQGGGITMSFDAKLLGDRVHYDPGTDTLTIKGVPPNLKDQLLKALTNSNSNMQSGDSAQV
tara:strand:+ start:7828 stop:8868 length:1041 start_codon:yes stop_codon:yes gene_type:complete